MGNDRKNPMLVIELISNRVGAFTVLAFFKKAGKKDYKIQTAFFAHQKASLKL